jgi:hypothetical protein
MSVLCFLADKKQSARSCHRLVTGVQEDGKLTPSGPAVVNALGCWITNAQPNANPYPKTRVIKPDGKKGSEWVHRLAYIAKHGSVPADKQVHHRCHNPRCFNPDHLQAITDEQNRKANTHKGHYNKPALAEECAELHPGVAICILPNKDTQLAEPAAPTRVVRSAMLAVFPA